MQPKQFLQEIERLLKSMPDVKVLELKKEYFTEDDGFVVYFADTGYTVTIQKV